jgi:hypothetical protein
MQKEQHEQFVALLRTDSDLTSCDRSSVSRHCDCHFLAHSC